MTVEVVQDEVGSAADELDSHAATHEGSTLAVTDASGETYGHVELADWVVETGVGVDERVADLVAAARTLAQQLRAAATAYDGSDARAQSGFLAFPATGGTSTQPSLAGAASPGGAAGS